MKNFNNAINRDMGNAKLLKIISLLFNLIQNIKVFL